MILLDADASIKLTKISIIEKLADTFNIILTEDVYREQVIVGLKKGYPDAENVNQLVKSGKIQVKGLKKHIDSISRNRKLGKGEKSIIHYYLVKGADLICSDDEAFIRVLDLMDMPYSPSVGVLILLVIHNKLTKNEGLLYLRKMEDMIKPEHFFYAKTVMEDL